MALEELRLDLIEARRLAAGAFAAELEGDPEARTRELSRLIAEESPSRVAEMAIPFAQALPSERALSAHALRQVYEVAPVDSVVEQIVAMLDCEDDTAVVAPLLIALGWTRQTAFLDRLLSYRADPSPDVRHAVSDVLPMFVPDARASAALIELARDVDADVRWSAVFELGSWIREIENDEISRVLAEVAASDPDEEIRAQAAEGLLNAANRYDGGH